MLENEVLCTILNSIADDQEIDSSSFAILRRAAQKISFKCAAMSPFLTREGARKLHREATALSLAIARVKCSDDLKGEPEHLILRLELAKDQLEEFQAGLDDDAWFGSQQVSVPVDLSVKST